MYSVFSLNALFGAASGTTNIEVIRLHCVLFTIWSGSLAIYLNPRIWIATVGFTLCYLLSFLIPHQTIEAMSLVLLLGFGSAGLTWYRNEQDLPLE
jgi:hypothetical protein